MTELATLQNIVLAALGVVGLWYIWMLVSGLRRRRAEEPGESQKPTDAGLATGFVTNFFDTLGIGSYAPTTSIFRFWKQVPDEQIPGTMNVGHTIPTFVQSFIFIRAIPVEPVTLICLVAGAALGAWLGASVIVKLPRRSIQLAMGVAMFAAAGFMLRGILMKTALVGTATGLTGGALVFATSVSAMLGALMTLGIGYYAPCMILLSFLGMAPVTAFPIMTTACAFLMPVASVRFIRANGFNVRAALGLLWGGIPAVLIAAFIVKELPLTIVRWLVVVVVVYTALGLLRTALAEKRRAA